MKSSDPIYWFQDETPEGFSFGDIIESFQMISKVIGEGATQIFSSFGRIGGKTVLQKQISEAIDERIKRQIAEGQIVLGPTPYSVILDELKSFRLPDEAGIRTCPNHPLLPVEESGFCSICNKQVTSATQSYSTRLSKTLSGPSIRQNTKTSSIRSRRGKR
jgi:hypothetical protein